MNMDTQALFNNIVRIGSVSSVDTDSRTVRVAFADKSDSKGNPLISAPLKVLQNQPIITIEKWGEEGGEEKKWDFTAEYNTHNMDFGLGESYARKKYNKIKDIVTNEGVIENKKNKEIVTIYPWLPYIGQFVVCLFLPNGESDGFVLGGI